MNKVLYILIFIFSFSVLSAQEKLSKEEKARREKNIQAGNPFVKYGCKAPVATLSKGKYLEVQDLDSIVTIGTMRWHVDNKQIVGRIVRDTLNPDAQPIGDAPGMWMSPDPLSEEFPSWSPYNMCFDNPMKYKDPDGRAPTDWFKSETGRVVWFDSTAKNLTDTNGGKWSNVGSNLSQVKQSLNVPSGVQSNNWTTLTGFLSSGKDGEKQGWGIANPVVFNNSSQVTYDLSVKNKGENGELVNGKTEISGINVNARVSSETFAPGMQITGVGGDFGVKSWTPTGFDFTSKSSPFKDFKGAMLSNAPFHATSDASLNLSLSTYKNLTNTSSGISTGLNLSFDTFAVTKNQATSKQIIFDTSK